MYSSNDKKVYDPTAPTEIIWFSIFMLGGEWRMGVVRNLYEVLTVNEFLLIVYIAKKDWLKSNSRVLKEGT